MVAWPASAVRGVLMRWPLVLAVALGYVRVAIKVVMGMMVEDR
jgi:hypothetical protein